MTYIHTSRGLVEIRELSSVEDMVFAEQIQLAVWGGDIYPHPKEILIPVQYEGGLLAGAFIPSGEMVGMIFQFPTRDPAMAHSQILAVVESWRGEGIGRRLKWFQREWCLRNAITRIRWTVDPLRAANAELNIRRLGARSSTYLANYYGPMQGIDAGAPSDRLLVEWVLDSPRVNSLAEPGLDAAPLADRGFPHAVLALDISRQDIVNLDLDFGGSPVLVPIPEDFINLAKVNPSLALAWRVATREVFQRAFEFGYSITGFTRVNGPAYLLEKDVL